MLSKGFYATTFLLVISSSAISSRFSVLPDEDARTTIDWKQIQRRKKDIQADQSSVEMRFPTSALPLIWPTAHFSLEVKLATAS